MNYATDKEMERFPLYDLNNEDYYKEGKYWIPPINKAPEVLKGYPQKAMIHDVTLRDGEQTPGVTFLEDERVRIAECLNEIGVTRIEAGMPAVSKTQFNALKRIADKNFKNSMVTGFARANPKDIGLVLDSGCKGIIIEHAMNPYYNTYSYKLSPQDLVERLVTSIQAAKAAGLFTVFMGWDWFRSPIAYTGWVVATVLKEVKFDALTIVDTFGSATPDAVGYMFAQFHEWFPELQLEFHGHNDSSLGVACALAALKNGGSVIHTSLNGLGGRSGNVATEEFATAAQVLYGIDCGVNLEKIYANSKILESISKMPIAPGKCIIGTRPYEIETGIATHVIKTFSPLGINPIQTSYDPSLFGIPGGLNYVLGKNSGKASIELFLERYHLTADEEQIKEILERIKSEAMVTKSLVSDTQALAICDAVLANR